MNAIVALMACAGGRLLAVVALIGTLLASVMLARAGTDAPPLPQLRDPFERPAAAAPAKAGKTTAASMAATSDAPAPEAPPPFVPELRAIMYEPERATSLVNISGAVLAVGESVHGYRVVKINERSVIVINDGARRTITLGNRESSQ